MASILPVSTSYVGRQLDLESLQSVRQPSITYVEVAPSVTLDTPKIVAGAQKLVQRYAVLFTTIAGSDVSDPDFGTSLYSVFETGNVTGSGDLYLYAEAANRMTKRRIISEDDDESTYGDQPDDEKLDDCWIDRVDVDKDTRRISVFARIRTKAGSDVTFVVPTKSGIY